MADDGRKHGTDPYGIAARREDLDEPPPVDAFVLSDDLPMTRARRWPRILRRWSAVTLAAVVATASAYVLGRSLTPRRGATTSQELSGRAPQRNHIAGVDLSPDSMRSGEIDARRSHARRRPHRQRPRRARHVKLKVGGGGQGRPTSTTAVTSAPAYSSAPHRQRSKHKGASKKKGHKKDAAGQAGPELPEPTVPLYHLFRTFKKKKPNHFFTGDATVKDEKIEAGYEFLATEGFMFDRQHDGTVAVPADNGLPGYIYEEKEPGSSPLYMLRGYNGYGDIFTSDAAYKDKMIEEGWNDFGIVGYIAQT